MPRHLKTAPRSEANIMRDCMMALSKAGVLIWRNNTGVLPDSRGIPVRFGLCPGSSDLIGIAPGGVFVAIEVKNAKGRVSEEQTRFIDAVVAKGGRAGVARSALEAVAIATGQPRPAQRGA